MRNLALKWHVQNYHDRETSELKACFWVDVETLIFVAKLDKNLSTHKSSNYLECVKPPKK